MTEQNPAEKARKKHSPQSAATLRRLAQDFRATADALDIAANELAAAGDGIWVMVEGMKTVDAGVAFARAIAIQIPAQLLKKKFHRQLPSDYEGFKGRLPRAGADPPQQRRGRGRPKKSG